ncbi:MAG: hypothetical protein EOM37_08880 [Proteobacteria bacterium]|jgi:hypothetical protein|nr:hypothetical protein [Alphaproteobacteria bacterium]NCC04139.1 hypothetical protein [Pseudomonadota bacterium]
MNRFLPLYLVLNVLCFTLPAYSCGPEVNTLGKLKERQEEDFNRIDSNRDRQVNLEEFSHYADWQLPKGVSNKAFFDSLDKDGSKSLSFSEWQEGFPPKNFMTFSPLCRQEKLESMG